MVICVNIVKTVQVLACNILSSNSHQTCIHPWWFRNTKCLGRRCPTWRWPVPLQWKSFGEKYRISRVPKCEVEMLQDWLSIWNELYHTIYYKYYTTRPSISIYYHRGVGTTNNSSDNGNWDGGSMVAIAIIRINQWVKISDRRIADLESQISELWSICELASRSLSLIHIWRCRR